MTATGGGNAWLHTALLWVTGTTADPTAGGQGVQSESHGRHGRHSAAPDAATRTARHGDASRQNAGRGVGKFVEESLRESAQGLEVRRGVSQ